MAESVKVFCTVPNGVSLRLTREFDDGTGAKQRYPIGDAVIIGGPRSPASDFGAEPIATEVDPEFWSKWLEQNPDSPLMAERALYVEKKQERQDDAAKAE